MRSGWRMRILALALALCLPMAMAEEAVEVVTEEMGELDLYDPSIYVDDGTGAAPQEPAAEPVVEPVAEVTMAPEEPSPIEEGAEPSKAEEVVPPDTTEESEVEPEQPSPLGGESLAPASGAERSEAEEVVSPDASEESAVEPEQPSPLGGESLAPASGAERSEAEEVVPPDASEESAVEPEQPSPSGGESLAPASGAEPSEAEEVVSPDATEAPTDEPTPEPTPEPTLEPLLADADAAVAAPAANLVLGLGEQFQLDGAAILGGAIPESYASDHPEIVSVDPVTGVVGGVGLGTATIAVTGGGTTVNYYVAVLNAPSALVFPAGELNLGKGERRPIAATAPEGCGAATIVYTSSKPKTLAVDGAGNLTAKRTGTVTLTATAYNGASATCVVHIWKAPSKVKLPGKTGVMSLGESRTLTVTLPKKSYSPIAWTSDNPGVVSVDAAGTLVALAPGVATVTATACNNKKASCKVTVLNGTVPTMLSTNVGAVALGRKEKLQIIPILGPGEAAAFTYTSSAKRIASVNANGLVTAKKAGAAVITVKTQNGLTATVSVTVGKAPKKIALSPAELMLNVGQASQVGAVFPAGTASTLIWESSDASVASVDGAGVVTALRAGTAVIRATTFNKKSAMCRVVVADVADVSLPVNDAGAQTQNDPVPPAETPAPTVDPMAQMLTNLRNSSLLGGKKDAILNVMQLLIGNGFEPAFAAGVAANIVSEGTYGKFESSKYISNYQKRPKYFCYLDGGDYYTLVNGQYELTAVYLSQEDYDAYTGTVEKRLRFGEENFYLNNLSGKFAQNVNLTQLEALMEALEAGKWQGKFGLGIVQWTGARTKKLVALYRKHAGTGDSITAAQVMAAENEMILNDFTGSYAGVYTGWKSANAELATVEAARSAGAAVCLKYEIPANKEEKAVTRGNKAAEIYQVMIGTP